MRYLWVAMLSACALGAAPEADDLLDRLEQELVSARGTRRIELLNQIAREKRVNSPKEAIEHAESARELAERMGDEAGLTDALNNLGVGHYFLSDYGRALGYYEQALAIAESLESSEQTADLLNNIGVLHYVWGDYDEAIDHYSRVVEIRRSAGDRQGLASAYNNLGNVFHATKQHEEALGYLAEALLLYRETGAERLAASTLDNIGLANYELERYEQALADFEEALSMVEGLDDKPGLAFTLTNLGLVYVALGRPAEAIDLHRRAIEVRQEIGDRQGVAAGLHNLGEAYGELGRFEDALTKLEDALRLAEEIDVKEIQRDIHLSLSELYQGRGDHRRALNHYRRHTAINAGLFDEQTSRRLAEWRARFDSERKDREIELLRTTREIQTIVRNVAIGGAVLLVFVVLLLYNRFRLKQRAVQEMEKATEALRLAHAERQRAARAELTHLSRVAVMGEFAASLAHELNQPLTAIVSNAQATRRLAAVDEPEIAGIDEALIDIVDSARRASELIRRLRDLVRPGETVRERLDIDEVLSDVVKIARLETEHHGIELVVAPSPGLPSVEGDPIQLQQVVINLVHNAVEAMRETEGDRRIVISTSSDGPNGVTVAVQDTGPGVDDAELLRIFQPFYSTKSDGLGMGLQICSSIVEAHGGSLTAERNRERGLTVSFSLPGVGHQAARAL